ncbi:hypothetical protein A2635_04615 [Candidatus Peribacteria bacterium RIFCSPHIGHO2_01_FULL_51_9]|nr:MAG: hypothetical protein A2635_04615 [Candidatus Peribacteria bacterium RIFCSPHIGHO2_01_FULL_51_9]
MTGITLTSEARDKHIDLLKTGDAQWSVRVPPHCHCEEPMRIFVNEHQMHLSIDVGEGAHVIFVETVEHPCTSYVVHLMVGPLARVYFFSLNKAGGIVIEQKSVLADKAHVHWCNLTLGCGKVTHTLRSIVRGNRAKSTIDWAFYGKNSDQYSLRVQNTFEACEGSGEVTLRGVAEERAHVQCYGAIDIHSNGSGTSTHLTEEVLMLDPTAKIDIIPALEIRTNDVKASHSATVSRVTPDDLFYFGSRGIIECDARRMFIDGFLRSVCAQPTNALWTQIVTKALHPFA